MGKTIMLQGTMANVGKSLIVVGMCRAFSKDGYKVAPFCAQSMAHKTFITEDGSEISRMQAIQAHACGIKPTANMNPVLMKTMNDENMRIVMDGEIYGNFTLDEYTYNHKMISDSIDAAFETLRDKSDILIMEGAGSPVEPGLMEDDMVNMGLAKRTKSPVILIGDIDRGGVVAQLLGTLGLFTPDEEKIVKGLMFSKFRGIKDNIKKMIQVTEEKSKKSILGVVPFIYSTIEDDRRIMSENDDDDNDDPEQVVNIVVVKFPHISNYVDYNPFECAEEVSLKYVSSPGDIGEPDIIMLPDTTELFRDLIWMRESGIETRILQLASRNKIVIGMGSGFDMLGNKITSSVYGGISGLKLLPFNAEAPLEYDTMQSSGKFGRVGGKLSVLSGMSFKNCIISFHDIELESDIDTLFEIDGAGYGLQNDNIYGINVHGLFDLPEVMGAIIKKIMSEKGILDSKVHILSQEEYMEEKFNQLAQIIYDNCNMEQIYEIIQKGV